ncbi:MAG: T9SS type A sorting domain-containing protein [Candidatus Cloacimonetes bacterium]|nr:T9SS type A sorting domain-containing protein [Candidatus Cloacimonadota bacterium]
MVAGQGDGTTCLATSPGGTAHTYVWDSFANLGYTTQPDIRIKITPSDTQTGTAGETGDFTVNNPNTPPTALVTTPTGTQTHDVTVEYTLSDPGPGSETATIVVEYSQNGASGPWTAATMVAGQGDGTSGLATSPGGTAHTYVWDSFANIPNTNQDDIRIKITPSDTDLGTPGETINFTVDNLNQPPTASVTTPINTQSGDVTISYTLSDPDGDNATIAVEYSENGGANGSWQNATMVTGQGDGVSGLTTSPSPGTAHTYVWNSFADIPNTNQDDIRIKITPTDIQPGTADETTNFSVNNLLNISISPATELMKGGETVTYSVNIAGVNFMGGFEIEINYSTTDFSSAILGEGTFLSDVGGVGSTWWYVTGSAGSYVANCAILGSTSGASGSGNLFTIDLTTAASVTGGLVDPVSDNLTLPSVTLRDVNNQPITYASVTGATIIIDTEPPTENINEPAVGVYYNTAPSFATFGFGDNYDLDGIYYQMDVYGGSWTAIATGISGTSWNNGSSAWAIPVFAALSEGTHIIYFKATDDAGNVEGEAGEWSWQFYKDTTDPTMEAIAEAQGVYYNTVPSFANFGFDDGQALDDGWYQMDSFAAGSWTTLFTNDADTEWNDDGWTLPTAVWNALNEGTHTIYFKATDDATNVEGEAGEWIWQFYKDTIPPAITYNYPATAGGATDWYSADPGNVINIDFVWVANSPLDYAKYKIGAGSWVAIFTADQSSDYATEWGILWTSLAEGENQISIEVADIAGNVVNHDYAASISGFLFKKDTTDPDPVTGLSAQTTDVANNSVGLSWTNPGTDVSQIQIWAKGFGGYPEYDDDGGTSPSIPADPGAASTAGWTNVNNANINEYTHTPAGRDFFYYAVYVEDLAGNYSSVKSDSSLCYWLGDTYSDGNVNSADVSVLGSAFGTSHGEDGYNNFVDVGPTTDMSRIARPTTDNVIDFEDLIVFAMNYENTVNGGKGGQVPKINPISLVLTTHIEDGQLIAELELGDNQGFVKGLRIPIIFGADLTVESVEQGDIWSNEDFFIYTDKDKVVEINGSALGNTTIIEGNGSVATITFNISGNNVDIEFGEASARTVENEEIEIICTEPTGVDIGEIIPSTFQLHQNYPNPFDSRTEIKFDLTKASHVRISVYNIKGQLIDVLVDEEIGPGYHNTYWSGTDLSSGIYFYLIETENYTKIKKMMLVR